MVGNNTPRTHVAYGFRREGKKSGRLIEIGTGRLDEDRDHVHIFLDRLPLGAFTGYVYLTPKGEAPPVFEPKPQRPGQQEGDLDESEV
jgi:hypothetical protein